MQGGRERERRGEEIKSNLLRGLQTSQRLCLNCQIPDVSAAETEGRGRGGGRLSERVRERERERMESEGLG